MELSFDAKPKTAAPTPKTAPATPSAPRLVDGFKDFLRASGTALAGMVIKYATQKASEEILERAVGLPPEMADPFLSQLPPGADVVVAANTAAVGWLGLPVLQEGAYELRLPTNAQGWVQMP